MLSFGILFRETMNPFLYKLYSLHIPLLREESILPYQESNVYLLLASIVGLGMLYHVLFSTEYRPDL